MVLDANGNLGFGTSSPDNGLTWDFNSVAARKIKIGDYSSTNGFSIPIVEAMGSRSDGNGTFFGRFCASYRRTDGTAIPANNTIGAVLFGGQAGTSTSYSAANLLYSASIKGIAEGSFTSSTAMPTAIAFFTGSTGDEATEANRAYGTERARISSDGTFRVRGAGTAGSTDAFLVDGAAPGSAARIDSSGRLLVGTTTFTGSRLTVTGPANATIPYVAAVLSNASGDLDYAPLLLSKFDNNNGVGQVFLRFAINNNSTANGQINGNGASQAAFGSWSDARLKENIVDLPPQLTNILSLRPVEFDYIASEGGGHQISFIAQDFEKVYPDAVGERDDGMKTLTGWGKTEARLVKAIQELAAKVTALEEQLNG
jgi:hypothetical protein